MTRNLKWKIYQQSRTLINLINNVNAKKVLNSSVYLKIRYNLKFAIFVLVIIEFCSKGQCNQLLFALQNRYSEIRHFPTNRRYITVIDKRLCFASYGRCAVQGIEDLSCNALKACHVPGGSGSRATTSLLKTILSVSTGILCKQYFVVRKYLLKIHSCILVEDHSKILVLWLVLYFCRILPAVKISLKTGELLYVFIVRICIFFYRK